MGAFPRRLLHVQGLPAVLAHPPERCAPRPRHGGPGYSRGLTPSTPTNYTASDGEEDLGPAGSVAVAGADPVRRYSMTWWREDRHVRTAPRAALGAGGAVSTTTCSDSSGTAKGR